MDLLPFLLACYGTTSIVTQSRIFARPRAWLEKHVEPLGYLARCPLCFGFWSGVGWALAGLWPGHGMGRGLELLAAGASSSAVCWMVRVVLYRLGEDDL